MKRIYSIIAAFVIVVLSSCGKDNGGNGGGTKKSYIYPPDRTDWVDADPAKYNFDPVKIQAAYDYIASTKVTSSMWIVGGECILKYGPIASFKGYMASCRKSVLAMLYGKYVENGTINLNTTIGELGLTDTIEAGYEDYPDGLTPKEKRATIGHLITARSGVYHDASNDGSSAGTIPRDTYEPGTHYLYNNWDFNAAGFVLEKLVKGKKAPSTDGKEIYQILQADLAQPIGMADWDIGAQRYGGDLKKSIYPAYHIYVTARDMARIAYLMLRKGQWKGKQIISEKWVKEITRTVSTLEEVGSNGVFSYGYMWWLFDRNAKTFSGVYDGAYMACGHAGQYMLIMPKLDMVAVWKTTTSGNNSTSRSDFMKALDLVIKAYNGEIHYDESSLDDIVFDEEPDF